MAMKDCIVILLSEAISFMFLDESSDSFSNERGDIFKARFDTDNNGFFDWLRTKPNEIIGVRWTAYDDNDFRYVIDALPKLSNIEFDASGSLCIYFGEERAFDDAISCSQDFGENNFYVGNSGTCAMSFSTLGIESLKELKGYPEKEIG